MLRSYLYIKHCAGSTIGDYDLSAMVLIKLYSIFQNFSLVSSSSSVDRAFFECQWDFYRGEIIAQRGRWLLDLLSFGCQSRKIALGAVLLRPQPGLGPGPA